MSLRIQTVLSNFSRRSGTIIIIMQHHLSFMILTVTLLSFIGCGQRETVQVQTPAKAASQMEQAFAAQSLDDSALWQELDSA